jgi:hypothetical protein
MIPTIKHNTVVMLSCLAKTCPVVLAVWTGTRQADVLEGVLPTTQDSFFGRLRFQLYPYDISNLTPRSSN